MTRTVALVVISASLLALSGTWTAQQPAPRPPIIDVHLHAFGPANWKGPARNPVTGKPGPSTAEDHMRQTLAALEQYNIVKAIVSGPLIGSRSAINSSALRACFLPSVSRRSGRPLARATHTCA